MPDDIEKLKTILNYHFNDRSLLKTALTHRSFAVENGLDYDGKCYISCSACEEDAQAVAGLIEEKFPKLNGKVKIMSIGTTIGSHTGPGTVALFFWGKERNE